MPDHFREERIDVLHGFIRKYNFASLVTMGSSGIIASHVPLILDASAGRHGTLRGHLSRANPQWRDLTEQVDALAIFSGPHHYISPSWYASTKEHGRVVPTWNYAAVHAYGRLRLYDDRQRLLRNVQDLTDTHEANFPQPWKVSDAPEEYIEGLLHAIVGIEMAIERIEGKWKVSQNRPRVDREGVAAALRQSATADGIAMADLVEQALAGA